MSTYAEVKAKIAKEYADAAEMIYPNFHVAPPKPRYKGNGRRKGKVPLGKLSYSRIHGRSI